VLGLIGEVRWAEEAGSRQRKKKARGGWLWKVPEVWLFSLCSHSPISNCLNLKFKMCGCPS
jgi:hypothetical protein